MLQTRDSLSLTGLDTLSERALRRLTERWTGELHLPDSVGVEGVEQVATPETFERIVLGWQRARDLYHDAAVEDVMGAGSTLDVAAVPFEQMAPTQPTPATDYASQFIFSAGWWEPSVWVSVLYNLLVVGMLLYYLYCICRYWDDICALFESVFTRKVGSASRAGERLRSDIFYGSLGKLFMLGACSLGVLAALDTAQAGYELPSNDMLYLPFAVILSFLLIVVVQYIVLGMVGIVTRSIGDVALFMRIRLTYFVLATILASPILLMAFMAAPTASGVWLSFGCLAVVVALVFFVRESVGFFISKKVSILHWILYLCTVEILPFSLLWQAVIRLR